MPSYPESLLRDIPDDWLVVRIRTGSEEFDAMRQSTNDPWFRVDHPDKEIDLANMDGLCFNIQPLIVE